MSISSQLGRHSVAIISLAVAISAPPQPERLNVTFSVPSCACGASDSATQSSAARTARRAAASALLGSA